MKAPQSGRTENRIQIQLDPGLPSNEHEGRQVFDLRPYFIIERLKLKRPIYKKTTNYGHFGREDPDFTWEQTDAASDLRTACKV